MTAPTNEEIDALVDKMQRRLIARYSDRVSPIETNADDECIKAAAALTHLRAELERVTGERDELLADVRQAQADAKFDFDRAESAERASDAAVKERDEAMASLAADKEHWQKTQAAYFELLQATGCKDGAELAEKAAQANAALASAENARREANSLVHTLGESNLTSSELKLVDKHCDWPAFKCAFGAVMKARREQGAAIRALAADAQSAARESAAVRDIIAERQRQISAEGRTPEHDDRHPIGDLADASACSDSADRALRYGISYGWAWKTWWRPTTRRCDLVKDGARIIADIERIDRAAARAAGAESEDRDG